MAGRQTDGRTWSPQKASRFSFCKVCVEVENKVHSPRSTVCRGCPSVAHACYWLHHRQKVCGFSWPFKIQCTVVIIRGYMFFWRDSPQWARASSLTRFLDHTQRRTTVSRIPLDEWSVRRRDLYLTTHNTHNRQTSMPPVEFGPTIPASERPQTYALDRAATGTGTRGCTASFIKTGCTCANNLRLETLNVY